jgi:sugar/nucleoside kinase (ribokinase family)
MVVWTPFFLTADNMTDSVQILGISNAIVDVLVHVDAEFLQKIGAERGSMTLIDKEQARELYDQMGPGTEMSGGSVANTIAGFANLGGTAAYIGKVKADQFGTIFNHDMRSLGVDVRLAAAKGGAPTARSHVLITADGQRTMQTYLGACLELGLADITKSTIGSPRAILFEGYVWDIAEGPALARKAAQIGKDSDAMIALSLSDSFCVERHRDAMLDFVRRYADVIVADEEEVFALLQTQTIDETLEVLRDFDNLFAITRSEQGSVVVHKNAKVVQAATPVDQVVDTTGAGDAYSAGFLFGWTHDKSLEECAQYGTYCATKVIQQLGARIEPGLLDDFD